jgi:hypothetical protein
MTVTRGQLAGATWLIHLFRHCASTHFVEAQRAQLGVVITLIEMISKNMRSISSFTSLITGLILCEAMAALLSILFNNDSESRLVAPWICLQAVILAGVLCGRLSGLVGSIAATATFATWLFPPVGSMAVEDYPDWAILLGFQLICVGVAFLCPQRPFARERSSF